MATGVSAPKQRTWTVLEAVRASGGYLDGKGVEQGRLDAEHLLAHVLGMGRLQLYLHFDRPLTRDELARFKPLLRRRGAREPLQYVLGSAPFRTLHLHVDRRVAIPRPETEYLIDVLQRLAGDRVFDSALDVGTGSGAIALALAGERLARSVTASDISPAAVAAAGRNAAEAGLAGIDFRDGPLLEPVGDRSFDLVLSNPPYLSEAEWRMAEPEVREWEPRGAMVAGPDGLEVVRGLVAGLDPQQLEELGAVPIGRRVLDSFRVEAGEPRMGIDVDAKTIPQETGLVPEAVSFTKGCFLGQELVARIDSRGRVNRHLRGIRMLGPAIPPAGAQVTHEGRVVGELTTVGESPVMQAPIALALIRREAQPGSRVAVTWDQAGTEAEIHDLPMTGRPA